MTDPNPARRREHHGPTADERAIRDLFGVLLDDWGRGDGEAYGSRFTEDADYVAFDGTHTRGRREIAASHQQLFDKYLKGTRLTGRILSVNSSVRTPPSSTRPENTVMRERPGPRRNEASIQTLVAVRREGEWRFAAFHNSRVRPISSGAGVPDLGGHRQALAPLRGWKEGS